ncbi:MAG: ATP-dependent RecD-like DNA helicase [Chloroflexi bacterium]|nr:ATP-dependent RecD-like DNA helicase [Chloroflexota bacterium]
MEQQQIQGEIEFIIHYNEEDSYCVLRIKPDKRYPNAPPRTETVNVVGTMPRLQRGESAQFNGKWVDDVRYGRQFEAQQAIPIKPQRPQGMISYLSSGIVKGIGPGSAEKIVNYFGAKVFDVLDNEPQRIYEVSCLRPDLAEALIDALPKDRIRRNALVYLQGLGINAGTAQRIFNEYGPETRQIIEDNPYKLAEDIYGIGFRKADQIAKNRGVPALDENRLRTGLTHALKDLSREGHTYAPPDQLIKEAGELLGVDEATLLEKALGEQLLSGNLVEDRLYDETHGKLIRAIYLPYFFHAETDVASRLQALVASKSKIIHGHRKVHWQSILDALSEKDCVKLSGEQRQGIHTSLTNKLSILTGGPGTGKTTILQILVNALIEGRYRFALAAPTGRAAKRLREATGEEASTIHRLLRFSPETGRFARDENNPLPFHMIVIDEASMLDLQLFHSLLKALRPTTHLLLVGDVDQLPSIGAGNVLRNVINSGIASVTCLNEVFRQSGNSHITINAQLIKQGEDPYIGNLSNDFLFKSKPTSREAADKLVDLVTRYIPEQFNLDPLRDIQVLAPMYNGWIGVDHVNSRLQDELNGKECNQPVQIAGRSFRVGDKVMQTRNNYDKDVFNGDIGFINRIDSDDGLLEIWMDDRLLTYDFSEAEDLLHAYCISIHRSQGSEYPAVVIPVMTEQSRMLQRNLLYTAITRAKKLVVLVGSRQALWIAIDNDKVKKRHTGLLQRLRNYLPKLPAPATTDLHAQT